MTAVKFLKAIRTKLVCHRTFVRTPAKNSQVNWPKEKKGENKNFSMAMCVTDLEVDEDVSFFSRNRLILL